MIQAVVLTGQEKQRPSSFDEHGYLEDGSLPGPALAEMVEFDGIDPGFEVLRPHFDEGFDPEMLRVMQLEDQGAVLVYDTSARQRTAAGDPTARALTANLEAHGLFPVQERRRGEDAYPYGAAVVLGAPDAAGRWTSVPARLQADLVSPNTFWVEVSAKPGWPFERVGVVREEMFLAEVDQAEWEGELHCEGFHGGVTRVVSQYCQDPPGPVRESPFVPVMTQAFRRWDRHGEWLPPQSWGRAVLELSVRWAFRTRRSLRALRRRAARGSRCALAWERMHES